MRPSKWQILKVNLDNTAGTNAGSEQIWRRDDRMVREIHSVQVGMTEGGTGDLASAYLANRSQPSAVAGDEAQFQLPQNFMTWGRTNQLSDDQPQRVFPPGFLWDDELWLNFEDGSAGGVNFMVTIIYRRWLLTEAEFLEFAEEGDILTSRNIVT